MINKQKWTTENIPNLKGKVVIVTGSSSGIGYEAARVIASKNAEVIIAARNKTKGDNAINKIKAQNNKANVKLMIVDLANLKSVENFAKKFKQKYDKLDLLINNAGVMVPPYSQTKDGFELQFGTNHLGHFSLTLQLLPLIEATPNSRIVNVSSSAHKFGKLDFDDINWNSRKYKKWNAYGDSKISNLYFTQALGKKLMSKGINTKVTTCHPGWTATELQRTAGVTNFFNRFFAMDIAQGVLPTLRAAFDENVQNGDFFGPDGFMEMTGYPVKVKMVDRAHDMTIAQKLWDVSEKLTGVKLA